MIVIDHAPHAWYLLRDGERWLLDVNCNFGLADGSLLLALSPDERARLVPDVHAGCAALAQAIAHAPEHFRVRDADPATQAAANAAIRNWRQMQDHAAATPAGAP